MSTSSLSTLEADPAASTERRAGPTLPRESQLPRPWILLCCVLVMVIGIYSPVAGGPFIWDDHHLVVESPEVRTLQPLASYLKNGFWINEALTPNIRNYYRPVTILSLALDYRLHHDNSAGFHLTNLALHVLNTALLFALLRRRQLSGAGAALASMAWALFPRLTEAVAWISGRTDVLATTFVFLALLVSHPKAWWRRCAAAALILLGLLSKEVALAGAAALLAEELGTERERPLRTRALGCVPMLVALGVYAALRLHAIGQGFHGSPAPVMRALISLEALGRYAFMLVDGWQPDAQLGSLGHPALRFVVLGALVLVGLVALGAWLFRRRAESAIVPWALSGVSLLLVLHFFPISVDVSVADRFLYLPLAGIVLGCAPALERWLGGRPRWAIGPALLALSYLPAAYVRTCDWSDEIRFWVKHYLTHRNDNTRASVEFGNLFFRAGMFKRALILYARSNGKNYWSALTARSNCATALSRMGHYAEGADVMRGLLQREPEIPTFLRAMALLDTYQFNFEEPPRLLKKALKLYPGYPAAQTLLDALPGIQRDQNLLRTPPKNTQEQLNQARFLVRMGRTHDGLELWRAAAEANALSHEEWDEFMWSAYEYGDVALTNWAFPRYRAAVPRVEPRLELTHETRSETERRLRAAWKELELNRP